MDSIVTVVQPAQTYDLVSLEDVKNELRVTGETDDELLIRWTGEESAKIATFCDRVFPVEYVSEAISDAWGTIQLSRVPIAEITSVTSDGAALDLDTDIVVDPSNGRVYRLMNGNRSCWSACSIVVEYSGGFDPIPMDVSQACLTLIKHRWSSRTRDPSLRSITIEGVGQKQFWVGGTGDVGDMPPEVASAVKRYRKVWV